MALPPTSTCPRFATSWTSAKARWTTPSSSRRCPNCRTTTTTSFPPSWSTLLNERSAQRRKADPKFQKLDERIKQFLDRKARHSIALNETKFKAEYAPDEDDPEHADEIKLKKDKKKKFIEREVWSSDFYNDEVLRIVGDYLTLGSKVLASNPVRAPVANP